MPDDGAGDDFSSIENLVGTKFNDWLAGDAGGNQLEGRRGNDWLFGGSADDTLFGGEGTDYQQYGSEQLAVRIVDTGRSTGAPGLPQGNEWTAWNAEEMRAAVEHLQHKLER